jgi:hypothetical protein
LRRAPRRCAGVRRDRNGGDVLEYDDRIGRYVSPAAYLDSMMTNKGQLSSLLIADFIGDLHAWEMLLICWSDGPGISSTVELSREVLQTRSRSSNDTQQPRNTRFLACHLEIVLSSSLALPWILWPDEVGHGYGRGNKLKWLVNAKGRQQRIPKQYLGNNDSATATNSQTLFGNSRLTTHSFTQAIPAIHHFTYW